MTRRALEWLANPGHVYVARVLTPMNRKRGLVVTESCLAQIRPAYNSSGLTDTSQGIWLVTAGGFDDLRQFDTLEEAKTYVEALFALTYSD